MIRNLGRLWIMLLAIGCARVVQRPPIAVAPEPSPLVVEQVAPPSDPQPEDRDNFFAPPACVNCPLPAYPEDARPLNLGPVRVDAWFFVSERGAAEAIVVVAQTAERAESFVAETEKAIRTWLMLPAWRWRKVEGEPAKRTFVPYRATKGFIFYRDELEAKPAAAE